MLLKFESAEGLDLRKFLDIYEESSRENAEEFYPQEELTAAVKKVEESFCEFLEEFFRKPGSCYWILEKNGVYRSALRLSTVEEGFYYLEALETRPDSRRKGFAAELMLGVIGELKKAGPFRICDCVLKDNIPSVRTHEKCGFRIVSEAGEDYLCGGTKDWEYGFEYRYNGEADGAEEAPPPVTFSKQALDEDDIRLLAGQEEYLKFKHLHKKKYRPRFDGAEDRCAFCWAKFGESEGELHEGYCSADEAHWICGLCFDCYKDKFGWQVEDETGRSFASAEELVDLVSRGGEIELRYHGILYNVLPMFTRETVTSAKVGVGRPFGPERLAAADLDGKTVAELIESGSMVFQLNREAPPQRVTSVEQLLFVLGADGFATADHGEDGYTLLVRVDDYEGMITIVGMIWKDVMLSDIPDFKVNGSRIRDIIADSEVLFRPDK